MTTTMTCLAAVLVLVVLPIIIIWNLTESKRTKIVRARRRGDTWRVIAERYKCSPSTARRWSIA